MRRRWRRREGGGGGTGGVGAGSELRVESLGLGVGRCPFQEQGAGFRVQEQETGFFSMQQCLDNIAISVALQVA